MELVDIARIICAASRTCIGDVHLGGDQTLSSWRARRGLPPSVNTSSTVALGHSIRLCQLTAGVAAPFWHQRPLGILTDQQVHRAPARAKPDTKGLTAYQDEGRTVTGEVMLRSRESSPGSVIGEIGCRMATVLAP